MNTKIQENLHFVKQLISQLENPIRSAKIKASEQLLSITLFPSLISNFDDFYKDYALCILNQFSNDTELVRENCIKIISNYIIHIAQHHIDNEKYQQLIQAVLLKSFERLVNEPSEHIKILLIKIIIQSISENNENSIKTLDLFITQIIDIVLFSLKSDSIEMKKFGYQILEKSIYLCSQDNIKIIERATFNVIIANCSHKNYQIRQISLHSLTQFYCLIDSIQDINITNSTLQLLACDKNSNVRKEVISFCTNILIYKKNKMDTYFSLIIPILSLSSHLVPLKSFDLDFINIKYHDTNNREDEALLALKSLNCIGDGFDQNIGNISDFIKGYKYESDNKFYINQGIINFIQNYCKKLLDILLPMIIDWTNSVQTYSIHSLQTFLQICGKYIQRYTPYILQNLLKSIQSNIKFAENSYKINNADSHVSLLFSAFQCYAILCTYSLSKDIIFFLLSTLEKNNITQCNIIILLLIIASTHNSIEQDQYGEILGHFIRIEAYKHNVLNYSLAHFIAKTISTLPDVKQKWKPTLITLSSKQCEYSKEVTDYYFDFFGKSISEVLNS